MAARLKRAGLECADERRNENHSKRQMTAKFAVIFWFNDELL